MTPAFWRAPPPPLPPPPRGRGETPRACLTASPSHRHRRPDRRPGIVALEVNCIGLEIEDRTDVAELELRQRARLARELRARLVLVIAVEMRVAERVDELPDAKAAFARDQVG